MQVSKTIKESQIKCFNFLMSYKHENEDFYFLIRDDNNLIDVEKNNYFFGDSKKIYISFWNIKNTSDGIYNISFVAQLNGSSCLKISSKNNEEALFLGKLVSRLNNINSEIYDGDFIQVDEFTWKRICRKGSDYLENLKSFIEYEKPLIDAYFLNNELYKSVIADQEFYEKNILTLFGGKDSSLLDSNKIWKDANSVRVKYQNRVLMKDFVKYLKENKEYNNIMKDNKEFNIKVKKDDEDILFELRINNEISAVNNAVNTNHPIKYKVDKVIIISVYDVNILKDDLENDYYSSCNRYNKPVYYSYFNMNNNTLSKEY